MKRIGVLLLCILMMVFLFACAKDEDKESTSWQASAEQAGTKKDSQNAAMSPESDDSQEEAAASDYIMQLYEDDPEGVMLDFDGAVLLDNEDITICAYKGISARDGFVIDCTYKNKTSKDLRLEDDGCIINGYTLSYYIDNSARGGMVISPDSSGTMSLTIWNNRFSHWGIEERKASRVSVLNEYCIDGGFQLTFGFRIGHAEDNSFKEDYALLSDTLDVNGADGSQSASILEIYSGMSAEELGKLKYNSILCYEPVNASTGDANLIALAVAEYQDGTPIVLIEAENTTSEDFNLYRMDAEIIAINGIAIDSLNLSCESNGIKVNSRGLTYIDTYRYTAPSSMELYGLSSIDSFDVRIETNDGFWEGTLNFGEESTCSAGELLFSNDYAEYYYVGVGPVPGKNTYSEPDGLLLIVKKNMTENGTAENDKNDLYKTYVDGIEEGYFGFFAFDECARNGAFYEVEFNDTDLTVAHELKLVFMDSTYKQPDQEAIISYTPQ